MTAIRKAGTGPENLFFLNEETLRYTTSYKNIFYTVAAVKQLEKIRSGNNPKKLFDYHPDPQRRGVWESNPVAVFSERSNLAVHHAPCSPYFTGLGPGGYKKVLGLFLPPKHCFKSDS